MKTAKIILAIIALLSGFGADAATQKGALITITNTPAGLTSNLTVNIGSASTRYWTNDASADLSTLIQTTNGIATSVTNLVNHLNAYPVYSAGVGTPQLIASVTNAAIATLFAPDNTNLTVTISGGWASVSYFTNTYSDGVPILNRTNSMGSVARTNAEQAIVNLLAMNKATNAVPLNSAFLRNYLDTNTTQTAGNKTLVGPVLSGGRWTTITNLAGTNVALTNVTLRLVTTTGGDFTGNLTLASNGTIYASTLDGNRITNAAGIAGQVHQIIGGSYSNGVLYSPHLDSPTLSNATVVGSTTISGATLDLIGDGLNNLISITSTSTLASIGPILALYRENGISTAVDSGDALGIISFAGYGDTLQRSGALIRAFPIETFTDSTAGAVLIFSTTPSGSFTPVGRLHIGSDGLVTVSNQFQAIVGITNTPIRGTNAVSGRLDFSSQSYSSLANGNNAGVVLGTNVFVKLSGATAAQVMNGFAAQVDGSFHVVQVDNPGLSLTIANNSGVDPTAANRILTGTGGDWLLTNNPAIFAVIYDSAASRWRPLSIAKDPTVVNPTGSAASLTNIPVVMGEAYYLSNTTATVSGGAGTWTLVTNTSYSLTASSTGFAVYTNALVYEGTDTVMLHLGATLSYSQSAAGSRLLHFRVYKNGTAILPSEVWDDCGNGATESTALHFVDMAAATNDRYQLYVLNEGTGDVTVKQVNLFAFGVK